MKDEQCQGSLSDGNPKNFTFFITAGSWTPNLCLSYMLLYISHTFGKSSSPAFQGLTQLSILAKILGNSFVTEDYSCLKILESAVKQHAYGDIMLSNNKAAKEA